MSLPFLPASPAPKTTLTEKSLYETFMGKRRIRPYLDFLGE
jgi:hypothetical protein